MYKDFYKCKFLTLKYKYFYVKPIQRPRPARNTRMDRVH